MSEKTTFVRREDDIPERDVQIRATGYYDCHGLPDVELYPGGGQVGAVSSYCGSREGEFCLHVWDPTDSWDAARVEVYDDSGRYPYDDTPRPIVLLAASPQGVPPECIDGLTAALAAARAHIEATWPTHVAAHNRPE
ncbi:hypothetical protein [Gordonia malaquae]|uniref:hypothetical protein n=1 Tax=Gordonia malaquae TaxID=410332 RepID=UPI0030189BE0